MRNYIVIFLLFFGWCLLSFSQSPYIFKRLTMADGMVSNYIVDIIQDKQGYIWMASESGLCKFDGKDFTIYEIPLLEAMHTMHYTTMKQTTQYG